MKLLILLLVFLVSCHDIEIKTHNNFFGSTTYEATDGEISVHYYNGQCCCVAKEVLERLIEKTESGRYVWEFMKDQEYQDMALTEMCYEVKLNKGEIIKTKDSY